LPFSKRRIFLAGVVDLDDPFFAGPGTSGNRRQILDGRLLLEDITEIFI